MKPYTIKALGMVNALGENMHTISTRLFGGDTSRLAPSRLHVSEEYVPTGRVRDPLPLLPERHSAFQCRNHALVYHAYQQGEAEILRVRDRFGPDRIGVVLGSSTSGLGASEQAFIAWKETGSLPENYIYETQHQMGSVSRLIARLCGLSGPAYTLSTACSSSAKAMASARGLIELGICDAVITGGADSLCEITLNGFDCLSSLDRKIANPLSRNRAGLNIGEGAALFLLTVEPGPIALCGVGESCDAYHMSAPHPEGQGAEAAMRLALDDARLEPDSIVYLNLHGTGTPLNDAMEAKAMARVFGEVPCSSTKPLTGHCLGAAGAIEAGFCWLALAGVRDGAMLIPPQVWDGQSDRDLPRARTVVSGQTAPADPGFMMSNSFAFGGNNCSLIIGPGPVEEKGEKAPPVFDVFLRGWSAWAPGLPEKSDWLHWLAGKTDYRHAGLLPECKAVPPLIRRRCGLISRMALETMHTLCDVTGVPGDSVRVLYGSRNGESHTLRRLLETWSIGEPLSPTLFSNSVHNTPPGYFGLCTGNKLNSRTVSAGVDTFAAGFLEAVAMLHTQPEIPVLLIFADELPDSPFDRVKYPEFPFAVSMILESRQRDGMIACRFQCETGNPNRRLSGEPLFDFLRWLENGRSCLEIPTTFGACRWWK